MDTAAAMGAGVINMEDTRGELSPYRRVQDQVLVGKDEDLT